MEMEMSIQNNELVVVQEEPNEIIEETQETYALIETETEPIPSKKRKKKSIVWEHFTIVNVGNGCRRASCNHCAQTFAYSTGPKVAGTSHLKRHIQKGTCQNVLRTQGLNTSPITPYSAPDRTTPKRRYRTNNNSSYISFDPDRCRREIAKMIILHDYPLHMVDHPGFVAFVQNLQPRFDMVSFNTVQGDCVATYLLEKQSLYKVIESIPGKICLTLDMWSSSRGVGYFLITGQFFDSEWLMHRKILNVVTEPFPDSDTALSHAISACISDWGLEKRVFTVTVDQKSTVPNNIHALLSVKNGRVLNGQLLIENCLARTLSKIAQGAMGLVNDTVIKVRSSVKYVKTSEIHEEKFLQLKNQLQVPSAKVLLLDDETKWNTSYEMLLAASELKEVFNCLDTTYPDYKNAPGIEDWKVIETLCMYLKPLYDTASILVSELFPTTNTFFHEAWKIQLELARASLSEDKFISKLTKSMQEIFDNYWNSSCFVLAIAVVMDPRFKMKLVEFSFQKIYGEEKAITCLKIVDEGIHELFHEYVTQPMNYTPSFIDDMAVKIEGDGNNNGAGLKDFDMFIMQSSSQQAKTELDQYLEESLLPRVHDFDVIGWWKLNRIKYPTLSKMARDILSIPVSTVGKESVFDTVGKEMDEYRCSLRPETVEALISAKDWLMNQIVEDNSSINGMMLKMEGVPI